MEYLTFPWEQLGSALRWMSLSGGAGNAAAWVLYAAISVSPLLLWGYIVKKKKSSGIDCLLGAVSAALFVSLWFLANPTYIEAKLFPAEVGRMGLYAFAAVLDSLLLAWFILHFLWKGGKTPDEDRAEDGGSLEKRKLLRLLQCLLGLWCLLAAVAAVYQESGQVMEAYQALGDNRAGRDLFFLILRSIVARLPEALELLLFVLVIVFLEGCREEEGGFGEKSWRRMELIRNCSRHFLTCILLVNAAFNILQLTAARALASSHYTVLLPLREVIIVLMVLLLSQFYLESRKLKRDNDLFI